MKLHRGFGRICNLGIGDAFCNAYNDFFFTFQIPYGQIDFYVPLKVSQIYKEFPLAQSTLINSFRRRTGYTIVQYLGIKKMEYAAQMLRNSENNVTDIAAAVGISSLSHFIHKFKEHFGVSPKEYQLLHAVDTAADLSAKTKDDLPNM
jgi:AraC-like DNA-binding protein